MKEEWYKWLALARIPGVGTKTYLRLIRHFSSPMSVFEARPDQLKAVPDVRALQLPLNLGQEKVRREVEREIAVMEKVGARLVTINDDNYPVNLRKIADPPPFLYVRGELRRSDDLAVAMVGSRNASAYGVRACQQLSNDLSLRGLVIISGFARGVDSAAHWGAFQAGGRTIAVLGCGIDVIYPRENKDLFKRIEAQGAVITELPPGVPPEPVNFPRRNRIISGMSLGVIVVEASARSGSLITARLALEQNREVFAVPGMVSSTRSQGTHHLIKQGAKLVECANDVLEEIFPQALANPGGYVPKEIPYAELSPEARRILDVMERAPLHIDALLKQAGVSAGLATGILLELELKGYIKQLPGKLFAKL
ncbi:MAG: DNA-protecting protein DprA [Deltaproteobacteria bacterium]|nr:DNA-protecting protein DprA [Deltaproteobacteria bacterium]